jgi:hypothetical protein
MATGSENPDEGGGPSTLPPPDGQPEQQAGADLTAPCYYDGTWYNLNARICDGRHQEWQCGTNGWIPTGRVCPR